MEYEYETNGVFWFPDFPEKIDGYYSISEDGKLNVLLIDDKSVSKKDDYKDVILGVLKSGESDKKITLVDNIITTDGIKIVENRIYIKKKVLPYLSIEGLHFNSLEEINFNELSMKYTSLPYWAEGVDRQNVETEIEDAKISLVFEDENPYFKVEFNSKKSLKECLEIEENIRRFLSFVSACDFRLSKFKGKSSKGEVEIIVPHIMYSCKDRSVFMFTLKDLKNNFSEILNKWFKLRKTKIKTIIDVHIASDHFQDVPVQYSFLVHVFALESYHHESGKFKETMFEDDEEEWESLKNCILDCIKNNIKDVNKEVNKEEKVNKEKVKVLNGRVEYIHNKSLKQKLNDILRFLGDDFVNDFIGKNENEINDFIKNTGNFRNDMVHWLESPPIEKVSKLIPKLKAILKACILKDLGFSDEMIIQGINKYLEEIQKYKTYKYRLSG